MFGVQCKLSAEILGLTLLAWGNSIGGKYQIRDVFKTQPLFDWWFQLFLCSWSSLNHTALNNDKWFNCTRGEEGDLQHHA